MRHGESGSFRQIRLNGHAKKHNIAVDFDKGKKSPYSMDANILHTSYEGGILEDPWKKPEESMWLRTKSIEKVDLNLKLLS